jgi:hypothetical protein
MAKDSGASHQSDLGANPTYSTTPDATAATARSTMWSLGRCSPSAGVAVTGLPAGRSITAASPLRAMTTPALSGRVGRRTIRPPRRSCGDGGHSAFERPAQVAVVAGHVLAVVSAHDRAVALFPLAQAVVG